MSRFVWAMSLMGIRRWECAAQFHDIQPHKYHHHKPFARIASPLLRKSLLPRLTYKPTMHAFAIFNALALGATLAHAAAIPAMSGATAPLQRRNGCYSAGELKSKFLKFEDLHGSKRTDNSEVSLDITTTCLMASGHVLKPGEVWTRCSE